MSSMNNNSLSHSLPGADDIHQRKLANGILVMARSNFSSPSVVVNGYLMAGSLFEGDDQLGLADFTADALLRGTERRTFHEIYDRLESEGASLHINGGTHTSGLAAKPWRRIWIYFWSCSQKR